MSCRNSITISMICPISSDIISFYISTSDSKTCNSLFTKIIIANIWFIISLPSINITIIELGGNDVLQGLQPSTIYKQLEKIIVASKQYGCVALIHVPTPQHYPIDYQQKIDTNLISLTNRYKITYISTFLEHKCPYSGTFF